MSVLLLAIAVGQYPPVVRVVVPESDDFDSTPKSDDFDSRSTNCDTLPPSSSPYGNVLSPVMAGLPILSPAWIAVMVSKWRSGTSRRKGDDAVGDSSSGGSPVAY